MHISKILKSSLLLPLLLATQPVQAWAIPTSGSEQDARTEKAENLKDDIRFSRDLARYRYFDLAVDWLAGIEKSGGLDAEAKTEVSLAKATISQMASEYALTREGRKAYYDDAVKHFDEAVKGMGAGTNRDKGNAVVEGFAKVLVNKGKFYTDELTRMKSDGADAALLLETRKVAEEAFREAVKTLNGAYADLSKASEELIDSDELESQYLSELALQALYRKGESYFYWALLYEPQDFNREDYLSKCIESLVDYMWEAGDETIFALYAYYFQGIAEWELGKIQPDQVSDHDEKALSSLRHIYSEYGIDVSQLKNLAEQDRIFVQGLMEKAYRGVADIYRTAAARIEATETLSDTDDLTELAESYGCVGDKPWMAKAPVFRPGLIKALRGGAIAVITDMIARFDAERLKLTEEGYSALLTKARTLHDAGNAPEALTIAKDVAENNENSLVGLAAQNLLSQLLQDTDEDAQPPSVLRLVADGAIAGSRWMEAVHALHGVIAASRTDEDRAKYLFQAWTDIGNCYRSMARNLEAALAFETGFDLAQAAGDSSAAGDLALEAYNAWDRRFRETKQDFDMQERNRVRGIVTSLGISGDIQFFVAREAFSNAEGMGNKDPEAQKKAYETAIDELAKVAESSAYYERSLVRLGRAHAGAGQLKKAIKTFDQLLQRIKDPKHAVGLDKKKAQQRRYAHAEAIYYKAGVLLTEEQFPEVLDTLEGYEAEFEDQVGYFPNVAFYRVRAKVGLGEWSAAEDLLSGMVSKYEGHATVPYATNSVATGYFTAYQQAGDKTSGEALDHLRRAAEYLDEYNRLTGYDSFQNLKNVADWFKEIGELARAEENYQRLIAKYGKKPNYTATIEKDVTPKLAEVLLKLHKFQEALPLWTRVYAANRKDRAVVRSYALCLGGWMDEKEDRGMWEYTEIPGAGQYQKAMDIWLELKEGVEAAGEKDSPHWWECMTNFVYCQYMLGKTNPQAKAGAIRLIANWKAVHPKLGGDPFDRRIKMLDRALAR